MQLILPPFLIQLSCRLITQLQRQPDIGTRVAIQRCDRDHDIEAELEALHPVGFTTSFLV